MARVNVESRLFQGEGIRLGKGANDRVPACEHRVEASPGERNDPLLGVPSNDQNNRYRREATGSEASGAGRC